MHTNNKNWFIAIYFFSETNTLPPKSLLLRQKAIKASNKMRYTQTGRRKPNTVSADQIAKYIRFSFNTKNFNPFDAVRLSEL